MTRQGTQSKTSGRIYGVLDQLQTLTGIGQE